MLTTTRRQLALCRRPGVIERPDEVHGAGTKHRAASHVTSFDHDQGLHLSTVGIRVDPAQYLVDIRPIGQLELVAHRPSRAPEVHPIDRLFLALDVAGIDSSNVHAAILCISASLTRAGHLCENLAAIAGPGGEVK